MDIFEFSKALNTLSREEKYAEALAFFKENKETFSQEQIRSNGYVLSTMLWCLQKAANLASSRRFVEIYCMPLNNELSNSVLKNIGYVLSKSVDDILGVEEQDSDDDEDQGNNNDLMGEIAPILDSIEIIVPLLAETCDDKLVKTAIRCMTKHRKAIKNMGATRWHELLQMTSCFNPENLSKECPSFEREGKKQEFASDLENWYACRIQARLRTENYEKCIAAVDSALATIPKLHYNQGIWFKRYKAFALIESGQPNLAVTFLEDLVDKKRDWYMHRDLGNAYAAAGDTQKAVASYCTSLTSPPRDLSKKWRVLQNLGQILQNQGDTEHAARHIALTYIVRSKHGWKISEELQCMVDELCEQTPGQEDGETLEKVLNTYWRQNAGKSR